MLTLTFWATPQRCGTLPANFLNEMCAVHTGPPAGPRSPLSLVGLGHPQGYGSFYISLVLGP